MESTNSSGSIEVTRGNSDSLSCSCTHLPIRVNLKRHSGDAAHEPLRCGLCQYVKAPQQRHRWKNLRMTTAGLFRGLESIAAVCWPRPTLARQLIVDDSLDGQKAQPGPQGRAAPRGPPPAQPRQVAAGLPSGGQGAQLGAAARGASVTLPPVLGSFFANRMCFGPHEILHGREHAARHHGKDTRKEEQALRLRKHSASLVS